MDREKLFVDNLDGISEVILSESEVVGFIEGWLKVNTFSSVMKGHGICRTTQTFNICIVVQVDSRTGKVGVFEDIPGEGHVNDPFFITLACKREVDLDKGSILGDAVSLSFTSDELDTFLGDGWSEDYTFERNGDGSYQVNYSDVEYRVPISVEDWMDKYSSSSYEACVDALLDEHLEDVGCDWRECVRKYYDNLNLI